MNSTLAALRPGTDLIAAVTPAEAPSHRNAGEQHANEDDDRGDLKPDKAAELAQDHFSPIAPWRGQRVADGLDAVGQSSMAVPMRNECTLAWCFMPE
jgi:hypothetical protein